MKTFTTETINAIFGNELVKAHIIQNLNNKFIIEFLNVPDNREKPILKPILETDDYRFDFGVLGTEIDFCMYLYHDTDHGPNYPWSSRTSVLNKIASIQSIECVYQSYGCLCVAKTTIVNAMDIVNQLGFGLISYTDHNERYYDIVDKNLLKIKQGNDMCDEILIMPLL
jgi:hypothetical protein